MFPRNENVDSVWARVARSVAIGPLREVGVTMAKVATAEPGADENGSHVVIVYIDNIYDKELATKVLTSLLEDHGLEPSASKSDLYTLLGIDSKHPSGMRSSIWRPAELIEGGSAAIKVSSCALRAMIELTAGPEGQVQARKREEVDGA